MGIWLFYNSCSDDTLTDSLRNKYIVIWSILILKNKVVLLGTNFYFQIPQKSF